MSKPTAEPIPNPAPWVPKPKGPGFLKRHPYFKNLLKLSGYIFVGYNTLMLASLGPIVAIFVILFAIGSSMPQSAQNLPTLDPVYGEGFNQLLSIKVSGTILGESDDATSPFDLASDATYGYDVKKKLMDAANNPDINGVILEINSPGGTIYGAHAIADGVKYYQETAKNPVFAHISGSGDSGAYWAAVSTDKIYADYGSDIGGVGVVMGPFKYYNGVVSEGGGLFGDSVITQNGIQSTYITAGKSKDIGNPYRKLTGEEAAALQQQVNNDYDVFVKYVSDRREIPEATIRSQIGAMSYDNKTALQYKLIDATASRELAYSALAKAAGIEKDFVVVRESSPTGFLRSLLSAVSGKPQRHAASRSDTLRAICNISRARLAYSGDVSSLCSTQ